MECINIICLSSPRSGSTWLSESFYNNGYFVQNEPYLKLNRCNNGFTPKSRYRESPEDLTYFTKILAKKCFLSSYRYWKNIFRSNSPVFIKCVRASHLIGLANLDDSSYVFLLLRNPIDVSISRIKANWPDYSDFLLDINKEELSDIYFDLLKYSARGLHAKYLLTWYLENYKLWEVFDVVRYEELRKNGVLEINKSIIRLGNRFSSTSKYSRNVDVEYESNHEKLRREWSILIQITEENFGYTI